MRTLVWLLTILAIIIWSGLALISHWVFGLSADFAVRNADQVPVDAETVEQISELTRLVATFGKWTIVTIWALGAFLIYVIAKLIANWLTRRETISSSNSEVLPRDAR